MTAARLTKGAVIGAPTRALTPARVVALMIIAMLVPGLVYIRFASQPTPFRTGGGEGGRPDPGTVRLRDRRR